MRPFALFWNNSHLDSRREGQCNQKYTRVHPLQDLSPLSAMPNSTDKMWPISRRLKSSVFMFSPFHLFPVSAALCFFSPWWPSNSTEEVTSSEPEDDKVIKRRKLCADFWLCRQDNHARGRGAFVRRWAGQLHRVQGEWKNPRDPRRGRRGRPSQVRTGVSEKWKF